MYTAMYAPGRSSSPWSNGLRVRFPAPFFTFESASPVLRFGSSPPTDDAFGRRNSPTGAEFDPPETPLSVYILTHNSEKYLHPLLSRLSPVADDLLLVDSGSTDQTLAIAEQYGCRVLHRPLDNFRNQREFALRACAHNAVLMLDSDEIPDEALLDHLRELKRTGFPLDAYELRRNWFVMHRPVHCLYPVPSPDWVVRLVKKDRVAFDERSRTVHEQPHGHRNLGRLRGAVSHYTFESRAELYRKLDQYTTLAARDAVARGEVPNPLKRRLLPLAVWGKWYLAKGGWRDGRVGWLLGAYAYRYTAVKLEKARHLAASPRPSALGQRPAVPSNSSAT